MKLKYVAKVLADVKDDENTLIKALKKYERDLIGIIGEEMAESASSSKRFSWGVSDDQDAIYKILKKKKIMDEDALADVLESKNIKIIKLIENISEEAYAESGIEL